MSDYEQAVFISYAWKGESEEIVNQIDRSLQGGGLRFIRANGTWATRAQSANSWSALGAVTV